MKSRQPIRFCIGLSISLIFVQYVLPSSTKTCVLTQCSCLRLVLDRKRVARPRSAPSLASPPAAQRQQVQVRHCSKRRESQDPPPPPQEGHLFCRTRASSSSTGDSETRGLPFAMADKVVVQHLAVLPLLIVVRPLVGLRRVHIRRTWSILVALLRSRCFFSELWGATTAGWMKLGLTPWAGKPYKNNG